MPTSSTAQRSPQTPVRPITTYQTTPSTASMSSTASSTLSSPTTSVSLASQSSTNNSDTEPEDDGDLNTDTEQILTFLGDLDSARASTTGWTRETARQAVVAKQRNPRSWIERRGKERWDAFSGIDRALLDWVGSGCSREGVCGGLREAELREVFEPAQESTRQDPLCDAASRFSATPGSDLANDARVADGAIPIWSGVDDLDRAIVCYTGRAEGSAYQTPVAGGWDLGTWVAQVAGPPEVPFAASDRESISMFRKNEPTSKRKDTEGVEEAASELARGRDQAEESATPNRGRRDQILLLREKEALRKARIEDDEERVREAAQGQKGRKPVLVPDEDEDGWILFERLGRRPQERRDSDDIYEEEYTVVDEEAAWRKAERLRVRGLATRGRSERRVRREAEEDELFEWLNGVFESTLPVGLRG